MIKELIPVAYSSLGTLTEGLGTLTDGLGSLSGEIVNSPEKVSLTTRFIKNVIGGLVISSCGAIGQVCIIVCGLSIMWFIINNKSNLAKEGFTGSIMVYIGTKLIEIVFK